MLVARNVVVNDPWSVQRWMSKRVLTLGTDDTIKDALELMQEHRIRHVPIVEGGALLGIVSDRDLRHALPLRGTSLAPDHSALGRLLSIALGSIMTKSPLTIDPAASIRDAAQIICREKVGALPVIEVGRLVGIVSAEDLLWAFTENTAEQSGPPEVGPPK